MIQEASNKQYKMKSTKAQATILWTGFKTVFAELSCETYFVKNFYRIFVKIDAL